MRADHTTLGADNGMGAAMMLAILEDESQQHGPMQLLFTTNEEQVWTVLLPLKKVK